MKPMLYARRGRTIIDYQGEKPKSFGHKSITEAKRESHRLQMSHDGALGRGTVRSSFK